MRFSPVQGWLQGWLQGGTFGVDVRYVHRHRLLIRLLQHLLGCHAAVLLAAVLKMHLTLLLMMWVVLLVLFMTTHGAAGIGS